MRRKTYRALVIFAVIVVVLAVAFAFGVRFHQQTGNDSISTSDYQKPDDSIQDIEPEPESVKDYPIVPENSTFEIHFFDVGEADSALVECDGHYMLIDGGNPGSSSFLYSYLQQHNVSYLDYIVCTHAHSDHVGGLAGALNYAEVGIAFSPVNEYDSRAFNSFIKYLNAQGKEITIPSPGETLALGSATVTFLAPIDMSLAESNVNNSSIILRIAYGETSFLFTGDAEIEEELSLLKAGTDIQSTVLKVGHHGSYTSSSEEFLTAIDPDYAIISVGKGNEYGHPHDAALERISKFCPVIYRTDLNGEVICYSDGVNLIFECGS